VSILARVTVRLFDCCWVEAVGYARPQLVIRKRLRPAIYAIDAWLYDEDANPLPVNPDAPRITVIYQLRQVPDHRRVG